MVFRAGSNDRDVIWGSARLDPRLSRPRSGCHFVGEGIEGRHFLVTFFAVEKSNSHTLKEEATEQGKHLVCEIICSVSCQLINWFWLFKSEHWNNQLLLSEYLSISITCTSKWKILPTYFSEQAKIDLTQLRDISTDLNHLFEKS